jgi:D-arabinose 1-dehydrogenase
VVRLALQYGINAIDTSPYYQQSEVRLGRILKTLAPEFPRESYYLISKVGRYGGTKDDFNYTADHVEKNVMTSLERLGTTYLDVALMHDVEFVSDQIGEEGSEGFGALQQLEEEESYEEGDAIPPKILPGDQKVLEAIETLFKLKRKGLVRNVGLSGYPLPVLLRISRIIASSGNLHEPLDVILSYSNHTLQCDLLTGYREKRFAAKPRGAGKDWQPPRLINASPFSMGLLIDGPAPPWHPASKGIQQACSEISKELQSRGSSLSTTAAQYGIRGSEVREKHSLRPTLCTIVGLSKVQEVHHIVQSYRVMLAGAHLLRSKTPYLEPLCAMTPSTNEKLQKEYRQQEENEQFAIEYLKERKFHNWCWSSP